MPAWITSLLREEVTVPIPSAASSTITSRPACASRRATARPMTPAPMTTHSTLSICGSNPKVCDDVARLVKWVPVRGQSRAYLRAVRGHDLAGEPVEFVSERFPEGDAVGKH